MGHEHIETPHLDKLASESALFRRGYVPTALAEVGTELLVEVRRRQIPAVVVPMPFYKRG